MFLPTKLHQQSTATNSKQTMYSAVAGSVGAPDPISSIASAVDAMFGTIGTAIQGKTTRDLMRQQGNQALVQNSLSLHSQRLENSQSTKEANHYTPAIILGLVALFVFIIILFLFKKP